MTPLKRRFYSGKNYRRACSVEELREVAYRRTPYFAMEYVEGGAEDEITLTRNRDVLHDIRFVPNVLVDTSARHQSVTLFGEESNSPLAICPTGLNGMLCRDADVALARAAEKHGIPFCLATLSTARLERVAQEAQGRLWMQLYAMTQRDIVQDILSRAEQAGYEALVFTVDSNVFGKREWDRRSYRAPAKLTLRNLLDVARHPRWVWDVLIPHGIPRFENIADFMPPEAQSADGGVAIVPKLFAPDITWKDVEWLREQWPRKLIVKGILSPADAIRAAEAGCDGLVVSNHGGRQLDGSLSSIEALPGIVAEVGEKMTILVDSGFRRGTDVVKALALGADTVMIGRATLFGLAAGGEAGVGHALSILADEIDRTLGQLGCRSVSELGPHLLKCPSDIWSASEEKVQ